MPIHELVSHRIYNTPSGRSVYLLITAETGNLAVSEPDTATFSVTASRVGGNGTIAYQWQRAEAATPTTWANVATGTGGTTASYTTAVTTISGDNGARFRCLVSNSGGSSTVDPITSSDMILTVNVTTVSITVQPSNSTVSEPDVATFSVTAATSPVGRPLTYQWQRADVLTPTVWSNVATGTGGTTTTYTTAATGVTADSGDLFKCVVSRTQSGTSATTNSATLTVNPVTINITVQPTAQTSIETQTATFSVTATTTPTGRTLTYQWQKAESTNLSVWTNVGTNSASYTTGTLTVAADNGDQYRVVVSRLTSTPVTSNAVTLTVNPITINITSQPTNQTVSEPDTATFSCNSAANLGTVSYQWQVADVLTPSTWVNVSTGTGGTTNTYTTAATTISGNNGDYYRCLLTVPNGSPTYTNTVTLTVNPVTVNITTQPTNQSVYSGVAATFTIAATTTPAGRALTYQWQRADVLTPAIWVDVSGATATSYTTTTSTTYDSENGDLFRCVATRALSNNATGTSNSATLTVTRPTIAIGTQPTAQTAYGTNTATFTASTITTTPTGRTVTYQWQRAESATPTTWVNVGSSGTVSAGSTSYTTSALTVSGDNGAKYRVQLTTTDSLTVTSTEVTLTVNPVVIAISVQPASTSKYNLETATFSVTAATTPVGKTITYQWQKAESTDLATWNNVGTNSTSYTTGSLDTTLDNGDQYRVLLSSPEATTVTSNAATLTVTPALINITSQPSATTVNEPSTATFNVTATTTPAGRTITYQWQKAESTDLATWNNVGTNSTSYTTGATTIADDSGDKYRVLMNAAGADQTTSDAVTLTVAPVSINITSQPTAVTTGATTTATFNIAATTTPSGRALTYQWQKAESTDTTTWNNIVSATTTSYTTGSLSIAADNGDLYRCVVSRTESYTSLNSVSVLLTVEPVTITITGHPASQTVTQGNTATFTVTSSVNYAVTRTYQWQKAESTTPGIWNDISGATSSSYTTGTLTATTDNGDLYRVVISAPGASDVTSNSATLTVSIAFDYLVVAGGGGGGGAPAGTWGGGGGAAGGVRYATNQTSLLSTSYAVTVGTGGTAGTSAAGSAGGNGGNSVFNTITSTGGGGGGGSNSTAGKNGGSGGGAFGSTSVFGTGIAGQGFNGGTGALSGTTEGGGGGGGAASAGGSTTTATGGAGGTGVTYFGVLVGTGGAGGTDTTNASAITGASGANGTGQGGQGGGGSLSGAGANGGAGGDGIVMIRYLTTYPALTISAGLTYTLDTSTYPGYNLYKFTAGTGTINW